MSPKKVAALVGTLLLLGVLLGGNLLEFGPFGDERAKPGMLLAGSPVKPAGDSTFLLTPSGRLDVTVGDPVDSLSGARLRDSKGRRAPSGGRLIPVYAEFHADSPSEAVGLVGPPLSVGFALNTGGRTYPVGATWQAPDQPDVGELLESRTYYLAVAGDADDVTVAVDYDDLTQTVDPRSGERDAGAAAALYDAPAELSSSDCSTAGWRTDRPQTRLEVRCAVRVGTTPWAGDQGGWAEPGTAWLVVEVVLRSPLIWQRQQAESRPDSVLLDARLDGDRPAATPMKRPSPDAGYLRQVLVFPLDQDASRHRVDLSLRYVVPHSAGTGRYRLDARQSIEVRL